MLETPPHTRLFTWSPLPEKVHRMVLIPPAARWPTTSWGCSGETRSVRGGRGGQTVVGALCPAGTHLLVAWRETRGVAINCMVGTNCVDAAGHSHI